ncbi:MAG: hypothetical protein MR004_09170 [Clostridiales bacterium]|nr:hypothetical protein [Clostridiales bacterium]MDY4035910.1 hypothetical protein [Candidatus Pseudoscilispira sp.]
MNEMRPLLLELYARYPKARLSDYIKLLYQSEFGCEHFAPEDTTGHTLLLRELETARLGQHLMEKVGGGYWRVYLKNARELGAAPETLYAMFRETARNSHGSRERFRAKLRELEALCEEGLLPFSPGIFQLYWLNYEAAGLPAVHHSQEYRKAYAPSYRVIQDDFARFFELFLRIDRMLRQGKSPLLIAIDGPCAAGKTTLSARLAACYDCNVFHTDDFYLRPEQKTPQRLAQPGGNMDRERLAAEVLDPLQRWETVLYRPYSCRTQTVSNGSAIPFRRLNIIEGSYSLHPDLRRYYDLKVVLDIAPDHQWNRLKRRESQKSLELFRDRWIPLEQNYARDTKLMDCADLYYPC